MSNGECAGCSRREFVRDASLALGAVLAGLGAASAAAALPVREHRGTRGEGGVSYAVPTADGAFIDKENQVILVRWSNAVYAFSLSCPHQRTALRWDADDRIFRCPKHKSEFKPEGTLIGGKAKRSLDRYALTRAGEAITVDTSKVIKVTEDRAAWDAAVVRL